MLHHQDTIAQGHGFALVVGDKYRGDTEAAQQFIQLAAQALAQLRIQGRQRFIQQQHFRARRQGTGQGHPLTLATGQFVDAALAMLLQAHQFQQFLAALVALQSCHAANLQAVDDIAGHIEVGKQRVVLEHHAHVAALDGQAGDVVAAEKNLAHIRAFQAGNQAQGGGLAAAGRAEDRQGFTAFDGQVQVMHSHGAVGECLATALQADSDSGHRRSPRDKRALMACNAISSGTIISKKIRV